MPQAKTKATEIATIGTATGLVLSWFKSRRGATAIRAASGHYRRDRPSAYR